MPHIPSVGDDCLTSKKIQYFVLAVGTTAADIHKAAGARIDQTSAKKEEEKIIVCTAIV